MFPPPHPPSSSFLPPFSFPFLLLFPSSFTPFPLFSLDGYQYKNIKTEYYCRSDGRANVDDCRGPTINHNHNHNQVSYQEEDNDVTSVRQSRLGCSALMCKDLRRGTLLLRTSSLSPFPLFSFIFFFHFPPRLCFKFTIYNRISYS